ncbi:MAG: GH25 family lysozyme M1 (1,4-beta-N-acetylmuramidase) [Verrucomicrobiales bacterium]|jgi:GH25 family lysozyme M1 (1,4-beta-N-acetylmuramidase)
MKYLLLLVPIFSVLASCSSTTPTRLSIVSASAGSDMQHIINVSSYDPKERQRSGRSFSENNVSSLKDNGATALIARAGKGGNLDDKCAAFIASADRVGMLPGLYYRVQKQVDPVKQADQFVDRAISLARGRRWDAPALLLCGDYDGDLPLSSILRFMDRVESRTGVIPVAYLENSDEMKLRTARADRKTRIRLRRAPYWLALYSHTSGAGPTSSSQQDTPRGLLDQYRLWNDWSLWQYGGVDWERGRSRPKVYSHDRYQFDRYFGDMDRPVERNVFRGSESDLSAFWQRHGLKLQ